MIITTRLASAAPTIVRVTVARASARSSVTATTAMRVSGRVGTARYAIVQGRPHAASRAMTTLDFGGAAAISVWSAATMLPVVGASRVVVRTAPVAVNVMMSARVRSRA